jgi:YkoY family integral membrane protein
MPGAQYIVPILFLGVLETLLSIDNAIVLAMLAKHLPKDEQKKALTYGLVGSVVFRILALLLAQALLEWNFIKILGGGYLIYVALKHLFAKTHEEAHDVDSSLTNKKKRGFWPTVIMIELMDIAFAVDSILAAVAISKNLWVIFLGGMMGVLMIRIAASSFIKLLDRFPGFEMASYLLILIIGLKLIVDYFHLPFLHFEQPGHPSFLAFWGVMLLVFLSGFLIKPKASS